MNIELRRRIDPFLPPVQPGVNDNDDKRPVANPRRVVIFKPAKSAMSSGRAGRKPPWLLEFEPQSGAFIEPLMGWTGSSDPLAYMQVGFGSREAAIAYAQRQGLAYEVRVPAGADRPRVPKQRADCVEAAAESFGIPQATVDLAA